MEKIINWEIIGGLTSEKTAAIRNEFEEKLKAGQNIKIDLVCLEDIDLAGFNLLISMFIQARRSGIKVSFETGEARKLMELAALTKFDYVFRQN